MTISAYALNSSTLNPFVTVYDSSGNPVAGRVIRDTAGAFTFQVASTTPGSTYYLGVTANTAYAGGVSGNYGLTVEFAASAEVQNLLGSGTLTATTSGGTTTWSSQTDMSLTSNPNGIVHIGLSTDTGGVAQDTPVQLTIKNASGVVVRTITVKANRTQSLEMWLGQGTYTLSISGTYTGSTPVSPVKWNLYTQTLSDPMMSYGYVAPSSTTTTYPPGQ